MTINPQAVGTKSKPVERSWGADDALVYALGLGAGVDDLAFTTENTAGLGQVVFPTMAAILGAGGLEILGDIGPFDWSKLVHAEQSFEVFRPIEPEGSISTVSEVAGIYDKGKAALVVIEARSTDAKSGEAYFTSRATLFIRGEGGWGGDPSPAPKPFERPDTGPGHVVVHSTSPDQALWYRLSGDRNPLHSDPSFAARAGFGRPILHGMCTYGIVGRALLASLCGNDTTRFRAMEGRFAAPVLPGDTLETRIWVGDGEALFQTLGADGRIVLDSGRCRFM